MALRLSDLVKDWGGFERLVASLHDTGTVTVEHDVKLVGKSGAERQIDVVVRHTEGLYEHLILVECKYWKTNVDRLQVDALVTAVRDLGASRGVIFSATGFQEGAVAAARHESIDLFKVRDLSDAEWGAPGQVVELYLQFYQASIGKFQVEKAFAFGRPSTELALRLGGPEQSATPTVDMATGELGPTLESVIEKTASHALREATKDGFIMNGGVDLVAYSRSRVNIKRPIYIPQKEGVLRIELLSYDLGIRIHQNPMRIDRMDGYQFALAVEDCVRNVVSAASKRTEEDTVQLTRLKHLGPDPEDVVKNGSVIKIYLKGMFAFEEMDGKPHVQLPSRSSEISLKELLERGGQ